MRRLIRVGLVLAVLAVGWFIGVNCFLLGVRFRWPFGSVPAREASGVATLSPDRADFRFMGVGASRAGVWGDADKGPYGAYTRFSPGFVAPLHHHTSDMNFMVLRGAYLYKPESGPEQRIESGSYIFIPAGAPHECSADAREGVLFYDVSPGKFDVVVGRR